MSGTFKMAGSKTAEYLNSLIKKMFSAVEESEKNKVQEKQDSTSNSKG
jgi:hypothetical protein